VVEHGQPELVQHQQSLRQPMTGGQLGQPVDDRVDLGAVDSADLSSIQCYGRRANAGAPYPKDSYVGIGDAILESG